MLIETGPLVYSMKVITAEMWLDDVLNAILNSAPGAQKPLRSARWDIKSHAIQGSRFTIDSVWGGRLVELSWQTTGQHVLPYTGSADGLETWIDIQMGRNHPTAIQLYSAVAMAVASKAYNISQLRKLESH